MGLALRAVAGATLAGAVTLAGLVAGPASAATATPTPTPTPTSTTTGSAPAAPSAEASPTTTAICRYYVDADKPIPVKSGPGKKYTTQAWISPDRERPVFGTCAEPGTGPSHWVKISQGNYKGGWVWRNWLDPV
ncbi:hypothetical protein [Nonomuraea soli]|uniref:Uncharacterized protein YgiM (DUF1202 family) n=1 Tax=Nonomuraea soli TaxID=1032476 RepID=A0A7W0CHV5_9ACTN|nr:hypothetical protein [Nonomuraea soli]MBA2891507.1 uncharacterized protein YgiM (DUF1202 family) [Nonomuraea soli]